jgi:fatty-acyl-CoA synthase
MAGNLTNGKIGPVRGTLRDWVRRAGDPEWHSLLRAQLSVVPKALRTTVPWLLKARDERDECLLKIILEHAKAAPDELAFEMDQVRLTWGDVDRLTSKAAHVLSDLGVKKGDVVALLGTNSPFYLVLIFAITRVGATAALINNHLEGSPLAHALRVSTARIAVVERRFADMVRARDDLGEQFTRIVAYGDSELEEQMANAPSEPFPRVPVSVTGDYVYIYTSGTTGLPKPCRVTHARSLLAGSGFGTLMFELGPGDKVYSVLPLYHSSALLIGVGSCVLTRTPMAMRESFSAKAFWPDVQRYGATAMLYIGELCRYLVNSPPSEAEKNNPIRVAVGNGMRADVWEPFQSRFRIEKIREFYSATEAPGFIFNLMGKVGSVGHVPVRRLGRLKLARYDVERDELIRDDRGYCIECDGNEVGELLIKLEVNPKSAIGQFSGYTDPAATRKKMLDDVFEPGDRYFRSGDLMRFDDNDFFYFVDRIGDTYRWKGENVSTAEVAEVLGAAPGVREAAVSSVLVPGMEGQAGLAAVVCDGDFDLGAFWRVAQGLPAYAQPRFVRVLGQFDTTGTFKIQKTQLRQDGVDPTRIPDPLFLRQDDGYVQLTPELWRDVTGGRVRL